MRAVPILAAGSPTCLPWVVLKPVGIPIAAIISASVISAVISTVFAFAASCASRSARLCLERSPNAIALRSPRLPPRPGDLERDFERDRDERSLRRPGERDLRRRRSRLSLSRLELLIKKGVVVILVSLDESES